MLVVRCKSCNRELTGTSKTQVCGCSNMMSVKGDSVTAVDLSKVVMVNSKSDEHKKNVLSSQDLAYQEARRQRKVRRLDFDVR